MDSNQNHVFDDTNKLYSRPFTSLTAIKKLVKTIVDDRVSEDLQPWIGIIDLSETDNADLEEPTSSSQQVAVYEPCWKWAVV